MAQYIAGLADRASIAGVQAAIESTRDSREREYGMAITPVFASLVATYGASVLLAGGEADASGRKTLVVRNTDSSVPVMISATKSSDEIYEQGFCELEPGCTATFTFTTDVPLYARSLGYEVTLEVVEA